MIQTAERALYTGPRQTCLTHGCLNKQNKGHQTQDQTSFSRLVTHFNIRARTNDKCLATKHYQTLFGEQTFYRLDTLFGAV